MSRIGGGGGGGIVGNRYAIKTMSVAAGSASGYSASEIEQLFEGLDPAAAAQAGSAHTAASNTLADIADSLIQHVQVLNDSWGGTAAQTAVGSFQQLHQTAVGLAQASAQTGGVLSWLGETILPFYKAYKAPGNGIVGDVESVFGHNPANSAAQGVMERLNNRLVQANQELPASVSQDLPQGGWPALGGHSTTVAGAGGSGSGGSGSGQPGAGGLGHLAGGGASRVGLSGGTGVGAGSGVRPVGSTGAVGHLTHLASAGPPGGSGAAGAGLNTGAGPGSAGAGAPGGPAGGGGAGGFGGMGLGGRGVAGGGEPGADGDPVVGGEPGIGGTGGQAGAGGDPVVGGEPGIGGTGVRRAPCGRIGCRRRAGRRWPGGCWRRAGTSVASRGVGGFRRAWRRWRIPGVSRCRRRSGGRRRRARYGWGRDGQCSGRRGRDWSRRRRLRRGAGRRGHGRRGRW